MQQQFRRAVLCILLAVVAACGDDDGTGPGGGGEVENAVGLIILPGTVLLPGTGTTTQLRAAVIQEDGDTVEITSGVSWQSSNSTIVNVSGSGLAVAGALGATTVRAQANGLTSPAVLVLVARPAAGALLVGDAQIGSTIEVVDATAEYGPGWRYRVQLRNANPTVGQIVLASGAAPVGGRVVSVGTAVGGVREVVLELLPLDVLFDDLSMNVQLSLNDAQIVETNAPSSFMGFRMLRPGLPEQQAERAEDVEFALGSFACKAEMPPGLQFPVSADAFDVDIDPDLTLELVIENSSIRRLVAHGSVGARVSANPLLTAAVEAKAECLYTVRTIILPIGGVVALFVGGQVPLGVGFEVGAKASFGQLGFDAFYEASLDAEFGIDCTAECEVVAEMETSPPQGFFKPRLPGFGDELRFELTGSAFGFAKLTIGNPFLRQLQFEAVELKAGIEQKFELAGLTAQANDMAYASQYALKPIIEFKTSSKIQAVAGLLGITLAELAFAPELPVISQSPRGTFTITPPTVAPGDTTALGDSAVFTVTLDPVNYLGAYAVERVEIFWRRADGTAVTLEPGRPGCTDIPAAAGQTVFTCSTDFLTEHIGEQTFYAFVHTRIFGVPIPVPLEIAADGHASITVTGFRVATTSLPAAPRSIDYNQTLEAADGTAPFTWSLAEGALPPGLSLSPDGVINGTPTTNGDFEFTVQATDANGAQATRALSIAVRGMEGTWTGTFNGTFTSNDGSIVRESPGQITIVLTQDGTALSGTTTLVTVFGPATGTAAGTFTGTTIAEFSMSSTSQTQPPCSGTFTGSGVVDVVAGTMTVNYAGSDCNGTISNAVAQLTRSTN